MYSQAYVWAANMVERKCVSSSVAAHDRGCWKGTAGSGWDRVWMQLWSNTPDRVERWSPVGALDWIWVEIPEVESPKTIR